MQYKVSELEGTLLDAAVAMAEGLPFLIESYMMVPPKPIACWLKGQGRLPVYEDGPYAPSTEWKTGGPIVERERINLLFLTVDDDPLQAAWCAYFIGAEVVDPGHYIDTYPDDADAQGVTPLIAAMRAYVSSKYGEFVEIQQ